MGEHSGMISNLFWVTGEEQPYKNFLGGLVFFWGGASLRPCMQKKYTFIYVSLTTRSKRHPTDCGYWDSRSTTAVVMAIGQALKWSQAFGVETGPNFAAFSWRWLSAELSPQCLALAQQYFDIHTVRWVHCRMNTTSTKALKSVSWLHT